MELPESGADATGSVGSLLLCDFSISDLLKRRKKTQHLMNMAMYLLERCNN